MPHPMPDPAQKPPLSDGKKGCLGCLGCSGIIVVLVLVIGGITAAVTGSASTSSHSPSSTSAAPESTTSSPAGTTTSVPEPITTRPETTSAAPTEQSVDTDTSADGDAAAALATLQVKGRAPKTGYDREADFGQAWMDVDRNGCDTRNDILGRDLTAVAYKAGTGNCKVTTGTLADPYTATTIAFTAGRETSSAVQIDHVVALSNAWQTGAQQLDQEAREHLANDPLNLLAVDGPANQQKSDGDAATWLPSNKGYRCHYVARQIAVKATYHLWVTQAEHDAMANVLGGCPGEALPGRDAGPVVEAVPSQAPAGEPVPEAPAAPQTQVPDPVAPAAPEAPAGGGSTYYKNCAAARAAGAAPLYAGQAGYRSALDRDGDGVACEPKK